MPREETLNEIKERPELHRHTFAPGFFVHGLSPLFYREEEF